MKHLEHDLRMIFGHTILRGLEWSNLELTRARIGQWQHADLPRSGERGGSSSPREIEERLEDRRVATQARYDAAALPQLVDEFREHLLDSVDAGTPSKQLERSAAMLARIISRYTVTIDHSQLEDPDTGCLSCARTARVNGLLYGPHWEPVYSKRTGLCRWCQEGLEAMGHLPPVQIVDLRHRVSPRKATAEWVRMRR